MMSNGKLNVDIINNNLGLSFQNMLKSMNDLYIKQLHEEFPQLKDIKKTIAFSSTGTENNNTSHFLFEKLTQGKFKDYIFNEVEYAADGCYQMGYNPCTDECHIFCNKKTYEQFLKECEDDE